MKKLITALMLLVALVSISQAPKYYDAKGQLIEPPKKGIDSTYIKALPATVTLTNLTKADVRIFKNLMLAKVQSSDKPYDADTKVVFDKIMTDLNTKADTVSTFRISNLPSSYLIEYAKTNARSYEEFIRVRQEARQFLRIAANVQKIDTAFYLLGVANNATKINLRKDLKLKP